MRGCARFRVPHGTASCFRENVASRILITVKNQLAVWADVRPFAQGFLDHVSTP